MYIGTIIVLVVIGVAFLGVPVLQSWTDTRGNFVFATYHGKDIAYQPGNFFAYAVDSYADRMGSIGINEEDTAFRLQLIWRQAYNDTLLRTATIDFAEKSGVLISAKAIDDAIIQLPRFQENNEFSMERYRNTSSQDLYMLSSVMEEDLIFQKTYTDLVETTHSSATERAFFSDLGSEKFSFRFVPFEESRYPDEEVIAYFDDHSDEFRSFPLSSISFEGDRRDLDEYRRQIVEGEKSFEEQARLVSVDRFAGQGGEQGDVFVYNLRNLYSDEVLEEILALEVGAISKVVEESEGRYALFRIDGERQAFDVQDEENLQEVRDYIMQNDFERVEAFLLEEASAFKTTATETGVANALREYDLTAYEVDPFPLNFGNVAEVGPLQAEDLAGISPGAFQEDFFRAIFSLEIDEISDPFPIRQEYYIAILDDIIVDTPDVENTYDTFLSGTKHNVFDDFIVKDEYLDEFFQDAFDNFIRPRPSDTVDEAQ